METEMELELELEIADQRVVYTPCDYCRKCNSSETQAFMARDRDHRVLARRVDQGLFNYLFQQKVRGKLVYFVNEGLGKAGSSEELANEIASEAPPMGGILVLFS